MSSNRKERIKGLHIKQENNEYSNLIPFGTEGQLIDMISTLDLEEEIKLGGNHYAELKETDEQTVLKEWYYTKPKNNKTKIEMSDFCTYSLEIIFNEEKVSTAIEVENEQVLVDQEEGNLIVLKEDEYMRSIINISLYKGDLENAGILIHSKTITIDPPNNDGFEIITEDL